MGGITLYAKVDQNGKFSECPMCTNVDFSEHALYCKMCGTYLFNDCQKQPNDYDNDYCGKRNPGDARYCEYCGDKTYLLKAGLIMTWEEVIVEHEHVVMGVNSEAHFAVETKKVPDKKAVDPFTDDDGKPIEISDDDLPF